jgi:hypothetical protein
MFLKRFKIWRPDIFRIGLHISGSFKILKSPQSV